MLNALLVDDEPVARRRLLRLLQVHADTVRVIGEAEDAVSAREAIEAQRPDVLFLDMEMPGEDGLHLVRGLDSQPLIVFTTAHDRFALEAFRENTVDYLLKPVAADELARAVRKLVDRVGVRRPGPSMAADATPAPMERILVADRDSLRPVPVGDVVYFEAQDKCTVVHTRSGNYDIPIALVVLESRLPVGRFLRIHRSHLVNVASIRELRRLGPRQLEVVLPIATESPLIVSRRHVDDVMRRLGSLD